jgi:type IV pilus assembly protein PilX
MMKPLRKTLHAAQRGVVLFIALIVLVAMSLAGIALMRSVDTGTIIAGNLAFRQAATFAGDIGVEAARTWLLANSASLQVDQPSVTDGGGYWATMQSSLDLLASDSTKTDFDWSTAVNVTSPAPPTGYTVRYVIHRLCNAIGAPTDTGCVKSSDSASSSSGTKGAAAYGSYAISVSTSAYYRITVRVLGPRNSLSYIQAIVY